APACWTARRRPCVRWTDTARDRPVRRRTPSRRFRRSAPGGRACRKTPHPSRAPRPPAAAAERQPATCPSRPTYAGRAALSGAGRDLGSEMLGEELLGRLELV